MYRILLNLFLNIYKVMKVTFLNQLNMRKKGFIPIFVREGPKWLEYKFCGLTKYYTLQSSFNFCLNNALKYSIFLI